MLNKCLTDVVRKLRECDEKLNEGNTSCQYKGHACGPFLGKLGKLDMTFAVMGANAELSPGFHKVLQLVIDHITPEAVRVWRLEGESGPRLTTRGTIAYMVHRKLAGAAWNAIARHVIDRVWFIEGAPPSAANRSGGDAPREGFGCGDDEGAAGGDPFSDPYSRFSGRASCSGGGG